MKNKSVQINHEFLKKTLIISILSLIISTILPASCFSFGSWTQETTAREICFLYTLTNDWQQTLEISKNPGEYSEANRILGPHPDTSKVNLYFAGCAISHALIAYILPEKLEKIWQVTWIGVQTSVTDHNNKNGLNQNMGLAYTLSYKMEF
jgi:hypothetical protein